MTIPNPSRVTAAVLRTKGQILKVSKRVRVRADLGSIFPFGPTLRPNSHGAALFKLRQKKWTLHSPQQQKFSSSKIHRCGRMELCSPYTLWEPPLKPDWYNDSNTYSHWKLCLCAKRCVFNCVDWFSHYFRSTPNPLTLKLECCSIPAPLTCIWYTDSSTICSPLPLVGFYQSLIWLQISN